MAVRISDTWNLYFIVKLYLPGINQLVVYLPEKLGISLYLLHNLLCLGTVNFGFEHIIIYRMFHFSPHLIGSFGISDT